MRHALDWRAVLGNWHRFSKSLQRRLVVVFPFDGDLRIDAGFFAGGDIGGAEITGNLPSLKDIPAFRDGWARTIRLALGMGTRQLAERIGTTQSQIAKLENNEVSGGITLRSLERMAEGLECELVYFMIPKNGTLQNTLEDRARQKAIKHLNRVWVHMSLESQDLESDIKEEKIDEEVAKLINKMPRDLWDD